MPSGKPGKFSTRVVSESCPPGSWPSITSGLRLARAAYKAAVWPAHPEPMMTTFRISIMINLIDSAKTIRMQTAKPALRALLEDACLGGRPPAEPGQFLRDHPAHP